MIDRIGRPCISMRNILDPHGLPILVSIVNYANPSDYRSVVKGCSFEILKTKKGKTYEIVYAADRTEKYYLHSITMLCDDKEVYEFKRGFHERMTFSEILESFEKELNDDISNSFCNIWCLSCHKRKKF